MRWHLFRKSRPSQGTRRPRRLGFRPNLEVLEGREVPTGYTLSFALDPTSSSLTASGTVAGALLGTAMFQDQAMGSLSSLRTPFSGTINTWYDPDASTLQFVSAGSSLVAADSGSWEPAPGGDSGRAAANYGFQFSGGPGISGKIAVRNLAGSLSGAVDLGGAVGTPQSFTSNQTLFLTRGFGDYRVDVFLIGTVASGQTSVAGYSATNTAGPGTFEHRVGTSYHLTVPIDTTITTTTVTGYTVTLHVNGTLVGNGSLNTPPTISRLADRTIAAGRSTGPIPFTVGDRESPATDLTVTATSSNRALVPDANIVLGGSGASRTITVTPAPGQSGTTTINMIVQDPGGLEASSSFVLTVTPPLYVTSLADAGPGTLRADVLAAVNGASIFFNVSGVIHLTTGEILLNKDLTICGMNEMGAVVPVTIDGSNSDRILEVAPGTAVTICDLTLTHGHAGLPGSPGSSGPGEGGAILNQGSLIVDTVTFNGNYAAVRGGAIATTMGGSASLVVGNSTFTGNQAADGGAIAFGGNHTDQVGTGAPSTWRMQVVDSSFASNTAFGALPSGGYGGAVDVALNLAGSARADTLLIRGCRFTNNQANFGGAISTTLHTAEDSVGKVTIDRDSVSSNQAVWGAGLYNEVAGRSSVETDMLVTNSTVDDNVATSTSAQSVNFRPLVFDGRGGGIYGSASGYGSTHLDYVNDTVAYNTAGTSPSLPSSRGEGGGIYLAGNWEPAVLVSLNSLTVAYNYADSEGGGLYVSNPSEGLLFLPWVRNCAFDSNTAGPGSVGPDVFGAVLSTDYNILSTFNASFTAPNDVQGAGALLLGPALAYNGGPNPTWTLMPQSGSPVTGTGFPSPAQFDDPLTDQRGFTRAGPTSRGAVDLNGF
jgi:predicted outer membrane repeat protein